MTVAIALAFGLLAPTAAAAPPGPAAIDRASWITPDDYPADALRLRMQGTVGFAMEVDVEGRVVGCTITKSSGYAVLDSTTCRLMKERGQYRLLRDEHSRPIPFTLTSTATWRLPTADQGRDRPVRFRTAGARATCVADYDGAPRTLPPATCDQITTAVRARGDTLDQPVTVWLPDALAPRR